MVGVKQIKEPPYYEITGWEELNQWGLRNHAHWNDVCQRSDYLKLSEEDRIKLLAATLLHHSVELMKRYLETSRLIPLPPILVRDTKQVLPL